MPTTTAPDTQRTKGIIFLLAAALFWSFGGLWIKLVSASGLAVAGARSAVAAVVLLLYLRRVKMQWSPSILLGAVAYSGTVILFVLATKNTSAANAILLQYTAPIYVALLSHRLLGERIRWIDWATILLVLAGMALFFYDGLASGGMLGNCFAVASGVFFALCVLALRRERHSASIDVVVLGNILTAIIGLPFFFAGHIVPGDLLYLGLLGTVQLGLGYVFFVKGIAHVSAMEGALIPVLEPILNPIWVALFAAELPSLVAIGGGMLVIVAVAGRALYSARKVPVTPEIPVVPEGK